MFVMDCYGHKLPNGVLIAHHLILDAPGGSSHLGYRRRVPLWHNPTTRVKAIVCIAAGINYLLRAAAISSAKHLGAAGLPRDFGALGPL